MTYPQYCCDHCPNVVGNKRESAVLDRLQSELEKMRDVRDPVSLLAQIEHLIAVYRRQVQ